MSSPLDASDVRAMDIRRALTIVNSEREAALERHGNDPNWPGHQHPLYGIFTAPQEAAISLLIADALSRKVEA